MIAPYGFATPTTANDLRPGDLFVVASYHYQGLCLCAEADDQRLAVILREITRTQERQYPYVSKLEAMPSEIARIEGDVVARSTAFEPAAFLMPTTYDPRVGALYLTPQGPVIYAAWNYRPAYFTFAGKATPQPQNGGFAYRDWSLVWMNERSEETLVSFPYDPTATP